ncbi:hypothetical protein [Dactylosporangium sp. CA-092794]|uniref:hypothetical protein n=1 Tax=Dactylosporangium sp. CA-092794 TaxID=3239929 RepID=UPI003D8EED42
MKFGEKLRGAGTTVVVLVSYLAGAVTLLQHVWAHPQQRILADNGQDQVFFEWVLTHAARFFTHGDNPFFTDQLNAPLGVNLMANTSVLGLALPLAPITLLFGAGATFVLIDTIALAGTAAAWYFVLSRHVVTSRLAAYIGGLFCGFAPSMISQSTGHPNIAGQFLIPFIVWNVLRLHHPGPVLRRALVLAALVVYQCFINEEVLFLTAVALLVFLLAYLRPREYAPMARAALPALGAAGALAAVILAYPLYHQFFGPQAYHGLPEFVHGFSSDLASFKEFSRRSIFAPPDIATIENMGGPTEENTFFGWPLLGLLLAAGVALWWQRAARAVFVTAAVFAALSLGTKIRYKGEDTAWTGPWEWLHGLPLFNSVVPTRMGVALAPLFGVLLALLIDRYVIGLAPAEDPAPPVRVSPEIEAALAADPLPAETATPAEALPALREAALPDARVASLPDTRVAEPEPITEPDRPYVTAHADTQPDTHAGAEAEHARERTAVAVEPDTIDKSVMPEKSVGAVDVKTEVRTSRDETTPLARWMWAVALVLALFPLIPTPQPADERGPVPAFFATDAWRQEIPENSTVVLLPLGWWEGLDAMQWATREHLDFKIAGGYFLAPDPNDPTKVARFGPTSRPTMDLINGVGNDGTVPQITPDQIAQARTDVAYWHANVLLLPDRHANSDAIRQTADQLFGPGHHVADVWLWNV